MPDGGVIWTEVKPHNSLAGLDVGDYQHLTEAEHDELIPWLGNVTLNETGELGMEDHPITNLGYLDFNLENGIAHQEGRMSWNDIDGTANLGMKGNVVNLQIGQEVISRVKNDEGVQIDNGQVVYVSGASGANVDVKLPVASDTDTAPKTFAVATEDIANEQLGYVTLIGNVREINTSGSLVSETWTDGDIVYLSATTAGALTNIRPIAPNIAVIIGVVLRAHATEGVLSIKPVVVQRVSLASDVVISSIQDDDILAWDTASGVWKNQAPLSVGTGDFVRIDGEDNNVVNGTFNLTSTGVFDVGTLTTANAFITGGTIDDVIIGGSTPNAGTFISVEAVNYKTAGASISGGGIVAIGDSNTSATDNGSMAIGAGALSSANNSLAFLGDAQANSSIVIGISSQVISTSQASEGVASVALGFQAIVDKVNFAIQIGDGTNSTASTTAFGVGGTNYMSLSAGKLTMGNTEVEGSNFDIDGGTIDGTEIGGTTPAAGTFTDVTITQTANTSLTMNRITAAVGVQNSIISQFNFLASGKIVFEAVGSYSIPPNRDSKLEFYTADNGVDILGLTLDVSGAVPRATFAGTITDGTLSINSGSITSAVNGTFSGTVQAEQLTSTDDITLNGILTDVSGTVDLSTDNILLTGMMGIGSDAAIFANRVISIDHSFGASGGAAGLRNDISWEHSTGTTNNARNDLNLFRWSATSGNASPAAGNYQANATFNTLASTDITTYTGYRFVSAFDGDFTGTIGTFVPFDIGTVTAAAGQITDYVGFRQQAVTISSANNAIGLDIANMINSGAGDAFAIRTGVGQIEFGDDTYWVNDGSGLQFAQIYDEDGTGTVALAAQDTFYQLEVFTVDGESNGATPAFGEDHITIDKAGKYYVYIGIGFSQTTAVSIEYDFHVHINNGDTDFPCISAHRNSGGASAVGNCSAAGVIDLDNGDTVEIWVERLDGAAVSRTITIQAVQLTLMQVGG